MRKLRRSYGEGNIRERKSNGRKSIYEGRTWVEMADSGTPKRISVYGKTREEVLQKMRKLEELSKANLITDDGNQTFGQYLDSWWNRPQKLKPSSLDARALNVKRIKEVIGNVRLSKINRTHILNMDDHFATKLRPTIKRPLSGSARRQVWAVCRKALKDAVQAGLIPFSPFDRIPTDMSPKAEDKEMQILTMDDRARLYGVDSDWLPVWKILIATGLRAGEFCALKWDVLDLEAGLLPVRYNLGRARPSAKSPFAYSLGEPKTKRSNRTIRIYEPTVRQFELLRDFQNKQKEAAGDNWIDSGFVITNAAGIPRFPDNLHPALQKDLVKAGLGRFRVHDFRHTFGYDQINEGTPILQVSRMMGHYSPSFTMDVYGHISEETEDLASQVSSRLMEQAERLAMARNS